MWHRAVIGLVVVAACGPALEATNARHVMIEISNVEWQHGCATPCQRALRPGERVTRCEVQDAGWFLDPQFVGDGNPPMDPEVFDLATRLGPLVEGYAVCTITAGAGP